MYDPNDLWPRNPKFNRGQLLVMTNHHTKLEDPWAMNSLFIDRTRFVYECTDWLYNQLTYAKQYTPTSPKGGIIINMLTLIILQMTFNLSNNAYIITIELVTFGKV